MLRLKKRKGQSTAEYAILIGVVISAIIAMQVLIGDSLKSKIGGAITYVNQDDLAGEGGDALNYILQGDRYVPPDDFSSYTETDRYSPVRRTFIGADTDEGRGKQRREIQSGGEIISRTGNVVIDFE